MGNAINTDAFYYNAVFEASQLEAKKKRKSEMYSSEVAENKAGSNRAENTFFGDTFFSKVLKSKMEKSEGVEKTGLNEQGLPFEIEEIQGMSFEKAEEFLIDSVYSAGDLLKNSPVPENFATYKKAVQNFLKFVQSQSYEVEEVKGIPQKVKQKGRLKPVTKQKSYTLVKVVNEKLDSLASDILYNQKEQLRMAAKIDDIKGLLVDVLY